MSIQDEIVKAIEEGKKNHELSGSKEKYIHYESCERLSSLKKETMNDQRVWVQRSKSDYYDPDSVVTINGTPVRMKEHFRDQQK